jgi:hypothetical protein
LEDKETKKKVRVFGEKGSNQATVTEEERNPNGLAAQHAKELVARAGQLYCPLNGSYLGSAVIHYYDVGAGIANPQFMVATQVSVSHVTENHADFGWKQLKSALAKVLWATRAPRESVGFMRFMKLRTFFVQIKEHGDHKRVVKVRAISKIDAASRVSQGILAPETVGNVRRWSTSKGRRE